MHRVSKWTELLHAVMASSGWEGARFPALAGRAIEGTLLQGAGGAEDAGHFTKQSQLPLEMTLRGRHSPSSSCPFL